MTEQNDESLAVDEEAKRVLLELIARECAEEYLKGDENV